RPVDALAEQVCLVVADLDRHGDLRIVEPYARRTRPQRRAELQLDVLRGELVRARAVRAHRVVLPRDAVGEDLGAGGHDVVTTRSTIESELMPKTRARGMSAAGDAARTKMRPHAGSTFASMPALRSASRTLWTRRRMNALRVRRDLIVTSAARRTRISVLSSAMDRTITLSPALPAASSRSGPDRSGPRDRTSRARARAARAGGGRGAGCRPG